MKIGRDQEAAHWLAEVWQEIAEAADQIVRAQMDADMSPGRIEAFAGRVLGARSTAAMTTQGLYAREARDLEAGA